MIDIQESLSRLKNQKRAYEREDYDHPDLTHFQPMSVPGNDRIIYISHAEPNFIRHLEEIGYRKIGMRR